MNSAQTLAVIVTRIEQVTPLIKHFTLASAGGEPLPAFSGGSHIIVVLHAQSRTHRNPYSLLSSPRSLETYEFAVRRMEQSRGGSHHLHDRIEVGSRLEISHPVNLFGLDKMARKHLLIAGGVGITPMLAHLEDLRGGAVSHELHYAVRSPQHAAFAQRLRDCAGERVRIYASSAGQRLDIDALLSGQPLGTHVYACGPAGLIDAVVTTAGSLGWPGSHVHFERFAAPPVGDAFEAYLARSRISVQIPPDRTLMESIEAAGVEVPYLCRGGVCGFCRTRVLELDGELLHNDHFLSDAEKASAASIMPCVSRAHCRRLVLEL